MHEFRLARILAFLAVLGWGLLLLPQFNAVIIAGAIASLTLPMYRWLRARMRMVLALSIYFGVLALCVILPLILLTVLVAPQAVTGYRTILLWSSKGFELPPFIEEYKDEIYAMLIKIPGFETVALEMSQNIKAMLSSLVTALVSGSIGFAGSTVNLLFQIFLVVFMSGLTVVYAPTLFKLTCRISTLPEESVDRFTLAFSSAVRSIFLGIFFVAFVQGILTGMGLFIFGVQDAAFLTLIAIFCGVIPIFGTAIVWVPMAITLWVNGSVGSAIGLVAWGMIVVAGSDNFLRPYCLKTGIRTSIIVLFLAIISSVIAFGPIGIILGPVIVAFGIQAVKESDFLLKKAAEKKIKN